MARETAGMHVFKAVYVLYQYIIIKIVIIIIIKIISKAQILKKP